MRCPLSIRRHSQRICVGVSRARYLYLRMIARTGSLSAKTSHRAIFPSLTMARQTAGYGTEMYEEWSPPASMRLVELLQLLFRAFADSLAQVFRIGGVMRQQVKRLLGILPRQIVLAIGKVGVAEAVVNIG
jgi:hypothetical protein